METVSAQSFQAAIQKQVQRRLDAQRQFLSITLQILFDLQGLSGRFMLSPIFLQNVNYSLLD
jgi:hypothetical protein